MTMNEILRSSDDAWERLHSAMHAIPPAAMETDGYLPDWSAKDLLAHLACWLAEVAKELAQMGSGTYERPVIDEDAMNARFHETCRNLPLETVRSQLSSSYSHMLEELDFLEGDLGQAQERIRLHWVDHVDEHLGRLEGWAGELREGS